jgi:hypothetical protein
MTVLDASAVPPIVGVFVVIVLPHTGKVLVGAIGAAVSTVKATDGLTVAQFPAASQDVGAIEVVPSVRVVFGVHVVALLVATGEGEHVQPGMVTVSPGRAVTTTGAVVLLVS